jgi:hypothetical protein
LAAARQRPMPEPAYLESERLQRVAVHGHSVVPDVQAFAPSILPLPPKPGVPIKIPSPNASARFYYAPAKADPPPTLPQIFTSLKAPSAITFLKPLQAWRYQPHRRCPYRALPGMAVKIARRHRGHQPRMTRRVVATR